MFLQQKIAQVIVDINASAVDRVFDYLLDQDIEVGTRVLVPFGNRTIEGYIIGTKNHTDMPQDKLKTVISAVDDFAVLDEEKLALLEQMKNQYNLKTIDVLRLFLPSVLRSGRVKALSQTVVVLDEKNYLPAKNKLRKNAKNMHAILDYLHQNGQQLKTVLAQNFGSQSVNNLIENGVLQTFQTSKLRRPFVAHKTDKKVVWTPEQERAIKQLSKFENKTYLLHGVTGSGKTEVYMGVISQALQNGKNAILLVPEISLTPQMFASLKARFGDLVAILHSGLSDGERFDEWKRILNGQANVVVGARSAIFAPVQKLGVIVVDEEHDSSYYSESNPRFSTHFVASFRANWHKCPLILGSATPSIETYYKTTTGEYTLLNLPNRVNNMQMPQIQIVDMLSELRLGNSGIFSSHMIEHLAKTIQNGEQAMLFLNRRGFSSFMMCRECGYVAKCTTCDVSLVYHKSEDKLKCHYCEKRFKALTKCPECGSSSIRQGAIGTQRVVDEVKKIFPNVPVLRMDNDTTQNKNAHQKILSTFAATRPCVLVGTQMIAKGHDFPFVTFVGIVDADQSLYHTDYKSTERTFALITQMSGRAGREHQEGMAILQTYNPRHYVYRFASNYDFEGFYKKEINLRQTTHFPPFSQIVRLLFSGENDSLVKQELHQVYLQICVLEQKYKPQFYYLNATKSPIGKIQNKHRYQILMRFDSKLESELLKQIYNICNQHQNAKVSLFVEINPQSLS